MYNWRILLGGAASAAILTVGVAAPALAQSVSRADTPTSLSGVTQDLGGSSATGILCDLPGIPMAGPEASAAAGAAGAPCASTGSTDASSQADSLTADTNGPASNLSSTSSAMPGLNSVSSSIPDLGSAAGVVPGTTGSLPEVGSVTGASQAAAADNVGSGGNLVPGDSSGSSGSGSSGSGSSGSGSSGTGSSGTTGLGSVTGTVNNLTGNLPGGNSVTNNLNGQGS